MDGQVMNPNAKELTAVECIERLENLFKYYVKDSEFNYQLNVSNSPFNTLKKLLMSQPCNEVVSKEQKALNEIIEDLVISQEALDRLDNTSQKSKDFFKKWVEEHKTIIENALKELQHIKEAEPSKAIEDLDEIIEYITNDKKVKYKATILFDCECIKYSLLKAQLNKLILETIKEKRVDLCILTDCDNVNEYNKSLGNFRPVEDRLTYDEFVLLKGWQNE